MRQEGTSAASLHSDKVEWFFVCLFGFFLRHFSQIYSHILHFSP